ncbi:MAG: photosynthetic complex putative assembly protein PuhB [Cohaesibacteraceae bacterium]
MNYIHNQDDYATEPVRGLPAALPTGEFMIWQGAPRWTCFAHQVFHTRAIAAVILLGATVQAVLAVQAGATLGTALGEAGVIVAFGAVGIGILYLLAWLVERTTVYTITNKRVLMRIGVAIQKTFNVPFAVTDGIAMKRHGRNQAGGCGSLSLELQPGVSLAYLILWPHARPWKMGNTQPTLRAIPNVDEVARRLTDAYTSFVRTQEGLEAAANPAAAAVPTNAAKDDDATEKPYDAHSIAKTPLVMAASLVLIAVIGVGAFQLNKLANPATALVTPVYEQAITFAPLDGDRIDVRDALTGDQIAIVEAGTDGLLRGALRGMGGARASSELDPSAPYLLQRFEGDGIYLADPLTGRSVRLSSFGPIHTGAVLVLLDLAAGDNRATASLN